MARLVSQIQKLQNKLQYALKSARRLEKERTRILEDYGPRFEESYQKSPALPDNLEREGATQKDSAVLDHFGSEAVLTKMIQKGPTSLETEDLRSFARLVLAQATMDAMNEINGRSQKSKEEGKRKPRKGRSLVFKVL
jgi:hypothetical protein